MRSDDYDQYPYEEQRVQLTPEQEKYRGKKETAPDRRIAEVSSQIDKVFELFSLISGGVRLNGEYVPVQAIKIGEAIRNISISEQEKCI